LTLRRLPAGNCCICVEETSKSYGLSMDGRGASCARGLARPSSIVVWIP
jgi:hypothetical protein